MVKVYEKDISYRVEEFKSFQEEIIANSPQKTTGTQSFSILHLLGDKDDLLWLSNHIDLYLQLFEI